MVADGCWSRRVCVVPQVFDYDFGLQDDFMGSAYLHLESLEQQRYVAPVILSLSLKNHPYYLVHRLSTPVSSSRTLPVTLALKDPQHPDQDLGTLELAVTLTPKHSPVEERRDSMVHPEPSNYIHTEN